MIRKGFTLIELLIVIAILGILSSVSFGMFTGSIIKGKDAKRKSDISTIARALEVYKNDFGKYPDSTGSDPSRDGHIFACMNDSSSAVSECPTTSKKWKIYKNNDTTREVIYLAVFPEESDVTRFYRYDYDSASDTYSLYAALENTQDKDVKHLADSTVDSAGWSVNCGVSSTITCNYKVTNDGLVTQ